MGKFRHFVGQLMPQGLVRAWRVSIDRRIHAQGKLFDGRDELFRAGLARATVYGEYGVGDGSTLFVLTKSECVVHAVDSSEEWAERVRVKSGGNPRLRIDVIDLGPVGESGRPLSYEKSENIVGYVSSLWHRELTPDFVLIDGRFRVACFLYSLLNAQAGTIIIFDDYTPRPYYFIVEDVVRPRQIHGRQALFEVPAAFDRERAQSLFERFLFVMD